MARKYSRILSAAKYYSAIDNYIKYITDASKRGQRVGTGDPRPASQRLFVDPFGLDPGDTTVAIVSGAKPTWDARKSAFTGYTIDALTAGLEAVKIEGYRAARVIITTGRQTRGTKDVSRITGLAYLKYGGSSTSLPFGEKTAGETQQEAFAVIRTAVLGAVNGAQVTLQPEKI